MYRGGVPGEESAHVHTAQAEGGPAGRGQFVEACQYVAGRAGVQRRADVAMPAQGRHERHRTGVRPTAPRS